MSQHFLSSIQYLREHEGIMLYGHLLEISTTELEEVAHYLQQQYTYEALSYPYEPPAFSKEAAIWAAQTVFNAAQLVLYREHKPKDISSLLPEYKLDMDPAAILSADLTLRFLPAIVQQLKALDPDDALIEILEETLRTWHYSGLSHLQEQYKNEDFTLINSNACLQQLYLDRIIAFKHPYLSLHPQWNVRIAACLGIYTDLFWKNFKTQNTDHGSN